MRIVIAPRAQIDIMEAADYIAADRTGAADAWLDGLHSTLDRLLDFPQSGRAVFGARGLREVRYGAYHVYYRVVDDVIRVLHLRHSRRAPLDEPL